MRYVERTIQGNRLPLKNAVCGIDMPYWVLIEKDNAKYLSGDAVNKFAEYEELEEQGRLIKLPRKIGDRVYQIKPALTKEKFLILEWTIRFFKYYDTSLRFADYEDTHYAHEQDIGKTVFFTREEAEAALEKMKGK